MPPEALDALKNSRFDNVMPISVENQIKQMQEDMRRISHAGCSKLGHFIPLRDEANVLNLYTEKDMILMFHEGVKWAREEEKIV